MRLGEELNVRCDALTTGNIDIPVVKPDLLFAAQTTLQEEDMTQCWKRSRDDSVRITYNEDSNVIMTVTGGASQLRGSELF